MLALLVLLPIAIGRHRSSLPTGQAGSQIIKENEVTCIISANQIVYYVGCQIIENLNLMVFSDQNPTDTRLVFGKNIISTENKEFVITFSPEMNFSRESNSFFSV